jgi:E3 ubiquitin-protein ligase DMA1/2
VTVCQSLFIAPCSHVYHYKCIRPLLDMHHPGFSCPLCRTFADLEADVEIEHRDVDPSVMEDVEMAAGDAEGDAASPEPNDVPEVRDADVDIDADDVDDADDGDGDRTSSSLSQNGAPIDADVDPVAASSPIAIARQDSGETSVFPGAEATPLNSTFLATLARTVGEGNAANGGAGAGLGAPMRGTGLDAIAMSDEGESAEEGGSGEVGGKRKR